VRPDWQKSKKKGQKGQVNFFHACLAIPLVHSIAGEPWGASEWFDATP
jgi:hypothetical protein